ncbi:WxL domain-containing protein [Carnobacterium maltaromaticum]|uniref:WxL domain-containing protein n=1 Tax=Carnobacterium maltaromaticum TaxID=2751 RepID=UPI00165BAC43|nr:WxL domain-containing protein [Carnobacterium maltaromaticum]
MKLTKLAVGTILLSSSIFVSTTPAFAALEDGQAAKVESNGSITLREKPVDPENPDNSGPLRIKSITNIEFGEQFISGDDQVYSAKYKTDLNEEGNALPDSLTVIDDRGTNNGWELQVKNDGFHSVVNASQNEGVGTTTHLFGTAKADAAGKTENTDVQLKIPGRSTKVKDTTYETTLTWVLLDDPSANTNP